ncbi:TetR/AcrR family transcriptional regulator [Aeromicrobium sp. A1-2]|uniref:TetR/AcrR family transcriptional regulator n=1 Tax=Aeromicrobium sp. A1-2 TaxID=2107713 RepID=UPI001C1F56E9|nr:TetR/AcrR family transcriptional regulator [Aeromicrobium sp. A1-2]
MSRLTEGRLAELYAGTLRLVVERGFDKLTMDQIAEATRSSKATLYRQWGGKTGLVVEALKCTAGHPEELPDTGSLRGDLLASLADAPGGDEAEAEMVTAIMHAMKQDPELAEAVRTQIIDPGRERIGTMLKRAVDRGEIAPHCPALAFADLLFMAPFVLSPVLGESTPDSAYITAYYEAVVLPALGIH